MKIIYTISLESILSIISLSILFLILTTIIIFGIIYRISSKYVSSNKKTKKKHYDELNLNANQNEIVFLGDSLTEFYDTDEFFHDANAYNRGIAGDTTDGVLNRLASNIICMQPRKLFLQIGTNDLGNKKTVDYVYNNIINIINKLKKYVPNISIYVISLYPVNDKAFPFSKFLVRPRKNNDIININNKLIEYCSKNDINYIDVHSSLIDENGCLKKEYTIEGLHINFEGYMQITSILFPYVN